MSQSEFDLLEPQRVMPISEVTLRFLDPMQAKVATDFLQQQLMAIPIPNSTRAYRDYNLGQVVLRDAVLIGLRTKHAERHIPNDTHEITVRYKCNPASMHREDYRVQPSLTTPTSGKKDGDTRNEV